MKSIILSLCFLTMTSAFANNVVELSAKCYDNAFEAFEYEGPRSSDRRKSVDAVAKYLKEGEVLTNLYKHPIATMDSDSLVYRGTGSEHSGWFEYAIIVDPQSCTVTKMLETYGE